MIDDITHGFRQHEDHILSRYQNIGIFDNLPLWSVVADSAALHPHRPAVTDAARTLTYAELLAEADSLAAGLLAHGLAPGERVVLQLINNVDFAVVFLALLRAGLPPVLALPAHRSKEIAHLARASAAAAYITVDGNAGTDHRMIATDVLPLADTLRHVFIAGNEGGFHPLPYRNAAVFQPPPVVPDHPALFLVSGGTTGLPKLIPRTHADYRYNALRSVEACGIDMTDVYLTVLPAAHNFPLACPGILGAFLKAAHVVFTTDPSPDHCFRLIERHGITATALVPALAQVWTAATGWESADLRTLRLLQVGGSKLAEADARAAQLAFPGALQQVFGMAEGLVCYTRKEDGDDCVATTQGRPMSPLDELRIVDAEGQDVPAGKEGELLVRGPYTLRGYYRAEEHNARAFTPDGFYRSGDRVRLTPDGSVIVTGRIKDVINRGGENIAADEVEEHILMHPAIRHAAVVPVPDASLGERVGAAIVCNGPAPNLRELRDFLSRQGVAPFKLPERLQVVASLPLTPVGKIDKKRIPGPSGAPWIQGDATSEH